MRTVTFWLILVVPIMLSAQEQPVLKMAFVNLPPFNYTDKSGQPKGLLIDLMDELSTRTGISYKATEYPSLRLEKFVRSGEVNFGITLPNMYVEGVDVITSSNPVVNATLQAVWIGQKETITEMSDLLDKKVLLVTNYTYNELRKKLRPNLKTSGELIEIPNLEDALEALLDGKGDYLLAYEQSVNKMASKHGVTNLKRKTIMSAPLYFRISKALPNAEIIMKRLVEALAQIESGKGQPVN